MYVLIDILINGSENLVLILHIFLSAIQIRFTDSDVPIVEDCVISFNNLVSLTDDIVLTLAV